MSGITILYILAQVLNIEATHVIAGLLAVINFFVLLFIKDIRSTMKELHTLYMEIYKDVVTLKAERDAKGKR